jgi:hypothetical protein
VKGQYGAKGVNNYLLKHLDQAIMNGRHWVPGKNQFGGLTTRSFMPSSGDKLHDNDGLDGLGDGLVNTIVFNRELVGLKEQPAYFGKLGVKFSEWNKLFRMVLKQADTNEVTKAIKKIGNGYKEKYQGFVKAHQKEEDEKQAKYVKVSQEISLKAIQKRFAEANPTGKSNGTDMGGVVGAAVESQKDRVKTEKSHDDIVDMAKKDAAAYNATHDDSEDMKKGVVKVEDQTTNEVVEKAGANERATKKARQARVAAEEAAKARKEAATKEAAQKAGPVNPTGSQTSAAPEASAEAQPTKRECTTEETKGKTFFAFENNHCYKIVVGESLDQDYQTRKKSKCNAAGFKKSVSIGKGGGIDTWWENGTPAQPCTGKTGKGRNQPRRAFLKVSQGAAETKAEVKEGPTCNYHITVSVASCKHDQVMD